MGINFTFVESHHMNASDFNTFLSNRNLTIATAESITAGLLPSSIASISGASSVLKGGIVTYQEQLKIKLLGVKPETLQKYSPESVETTIEMVNGLANLGLNSDIYVAVTGVASASVNVYKVTKPVGQIYVAVLFKNQLSTFETVLKSDFEKDSRNEIREKAVGFIFDKVVEVVLKG